MVSNIDIYLFTKLIGFRVAAYERPEIVYILI